MDSADNWISPFEFTLIRLLGSVPILFGTVPRLFGTSQDYSGLSKDSLVLSQDFSLLSRDFSVMSQDFSALSQDFPLLSQDLLVLSRDFSALSQDFLVLSQVFLVLSQDISAQSKTFRYCPKTIRHCPKTSWYCPQTSWFRPKTSLYCPRTLSLQCWDTLISSSSLLGLLNHYPWYHHLSSSIKISPKPNLTGQKFQMLTPLYLSHFINLMQVEIQLVRRFVVITCLFKIDKISTENVKTQTRKNYKNRKMNSP